MAVNPSKRTEPPSQLAKLWSGLSVSVRYEATYRMQERAPRFRSLERRYTYWLRMDGYGYGYGWMDGEKASSKVTGRGTFEKYSRCFVDDAKRVLVLVEIFIFLFFILFCKPETRS